MVDDEPSGAVRRRQDMRPSLRKAEQGDQGRGRLRAGAQAGDTAVDRVSFRVFRRGTRPEPGPPLEL